MCVCHVLALLSHPAEGFERGFHVFLRQAHQQAVVLHADLIHGLAAALLQPPLHLRGQVLEAVLRGVHQLQLDHTTQPELKITAALCG